MKKKVIQIIALLCIATAAILSIYMGYMNLSGVCVPRIPILIFPLVGVASALYLYQEIREPKGEKGRKSNIIMFGISTIASIVFIIIWLVR